MRKKLTLIGNQDLGKSAIIQGFQSRMFPYHSPVVNVFPDEGEWDYAPVGKKGPVTVFVTRAPPDLAGAGVPYSAGDGGCKPVFPFRFRLPCRCLAAAWLGRPDWVLPIQVPDIRVPGTLGVSIIVQLVSPGRRLRLTYALPVR